MADSIAPEERELWHSRGVRKISAKNFYIYYRPDEVSGRVYVLNVIYAKRDQLKLFHRDINARAAGRTSICSRDISL